MDPIRILIADDHPLFRDGLRSLLESVGDMQVVGEAATGDEALARTLALQPEIILMDIKMPGLNGIEASRRILQASPHIRILILTMFEDDQSVFAAIRAGARGYLLKGAVQEETLRAIRAVLANCCATPAISPAVSACGTLWASPNGSPVGPSGCQPPACGGIGLLPRQLSEGVPPDVLICRPATFPCRY